MEHYYFFTCRYDFGNEYSVVDRKIIEEYQRDQQKIAEEIQSNPTMQHMRSVGQRVYESLVKASKTLPMYQWLIALPQMISRICHVNDGICGKLTRHITFKVMVVFPQQTLWSIAAAANSNNRKRRSKAAEIMDKVRQRLQQGASDEEQKKIKGGHYSVHKQSYAAFVSLSDLFIKLCMHNPGKNCKGPLHISKDFPQLRTALTNNKGLVRNILHEYHCCHHRFSRLTHLIFPYSL